jgi:acyl-CoA synthetase (AMP-forming)/AMP-acid ligase II
MRHPKVAEAQVIGMPDAFMGEELCALVRLKPEERADEEELRAYCRASISRQKVPKYIRFVTAFPLTASGNEYSILKSGEEDNGNPDERSTGSAANSRSHRARHD